ncbi:FAD-binding oxidoreductase [Actinokineospora soli]|uniref:FAD-binding oxidoreductase n=1 Tax=Actinokineospora soli TaxID=1048753 RepID=A0ABW2TJG8_9PSEU
MPVPTASLRTNVRGQVLEPGDDGYDAARLVYLGGIDQHPAVVVRPADAADVAAVVKLAAGTGTPLAVKGGGHSPFCVTEGILIDLSSLNGHEVDTAARTAWADAGLTAGAFTAATAEHGLVTGFGDTAGVGLGGITTGGGIGYLVRKHGLTIDDLLAAEVVTADGAVRAVDADTEPELFWAIRGGGGNFGVVTRMKFRLHELPAVTGGLLVLPATPESIAGFVKHADEAPEEVSAIANVFPCPPMPFVPEEWHGSPVIMATVVYAGVGEAAEEALTPFRELATPIADMIGEKPFPEVYSNMPADYHPVAVTRNLFTDDIDADDAALLLARIAESTSSMPAVQIRVLGGAMARVPADATAFAHRSRRIMVNIAAFYTGSADEHTRWADDLTEALQKGAPGVYVNFLGDDSETRIREAYPDETWARLRRAKRDYDPANLFRSNSNIPPA